MKKLLLSLLFIPFFASAFGGSIIPSKYLEEYQNRMEQMKYKVKYLVVLGKIKAAEQQLIATQNSNKYYEFKNTQIEPLQVLAHTFEDLASVDYHSNPTWIYSTYTSQKESLDRLMTWTDRSTSIKDRLYANYKALITYADNQLTDAVTRDDNDYVRVNGHRLINE